MRATTNGNNSDLSEHDACDVGSGRSAKIEKHLSAPLGVKNPGSPAGENGRALLDERPGRLTVILGATGLHLVQGFHIEQLGQIATFGAVQIALHQAERDRGSLREGPSELHRRIVQLIVRHYAVDETERQRLVGIDRPAGEIKFARFGGPNQPCQKITAAEVAGKADPDKGGYQPCRGPGDPKIASEGESKSGTRRWTVDHRNRRFRQLV